MTYIRGMLLLVSSRHSFFQDFQSVRGTNYGDIFIPQRINRIHVPHFRHFYGTNVTEASLHRCVASRERNVERVLLSFRQFLRAGDGAESGDNRFRAFRLRARGRERIDEKKFSVTELFRKRHRKRPRAHLLARLLFVIALVPRPESGATAFPKRGTDGAVTRATGALLLPRLLAAAGDLSPVLCMRRALPRV